jgi:hypothetical protein
VNVNDAFERLQRANPVLGDVGAPPIEHVLGRVDEVPTVRLPAPRRAGAASWVGVLAGVVIAVAVGGLLLTAHSRSPADATASHAQSGPRQLISILGVLRRPQTAGDRSVPWPAVEVDRRFYDQPILTLTRRVFTFPNGRGLFLVVVTHPTRFGVPPSLPARIGDGVALWSLCCNGTAESAASLRAHAQLLPEERGVPHAHAKYYSYSIVPDGVARVRWVFAALHSPTQTHSQATVWTTVHNNAAVAAVAPIPRPVLSATWYAADGHVIAKHTWNRSRRLCKRHPGNCQSYL